MVGLEGETSNTFFEELQDWEQLLTAENLTILMEDQAYED